MGKQKERKTERAQMDQKIADSRFAAAQYDPRFQRFPKAKAKIEIDDRFAGLFKDVAFQSRVAVDKRGRKLGKHKHKEDMRKYYRLQNEEEDWGREAQPDGNAENADGAKEGKKGLNTGAKQGQSKAKPQHSAAEKGAKTKEAPTKRTTRKSEKKRAAKSEPSRKFSTMDVTWSSDQTDDSDPDAHADYGLEADKHSSGSDTGADSDSTDDSDSLDKKDQTAAERWARVRGLAGPDTSSSDDDSSSGDFADSDESSEQDVDLSEWGVGAMAANPEEKVPEAREETARLAILDLDWSKVQAVDILAMLKSFLSKGQSITKVTVYPSDYGLRRMAEEEKLGPVGLFGQSSSVAAEAAEKLAKNASHNGGNFEMSAAERAAILETLNEQDSGEEDAGNGSEDDKEFPNKEGESPEDSDDIDGHGARQASGREAEASGSEDDEVSRRRLQLYERSRLRYYYAIVECSDIATAAHLYKECDGMEFEHSASTFDLRFVPDSEDFSARNVRDKATDVPAGYKPPDVKIAAMLHTKPRLTWDADDDDRKRTLSRRLTKEQLRDDDFKAYLGSESDEESERDETAGERYKQLLNGSAGDVGRGGTKDWDVGEGSLDEEAESGIMRPGKADRSMELEVTFGGGLDELSQRLKAKREETASRKHDTVWEAYLRRKREKRLQAKRIGKKADSEEDDSDGDNEHDDPYFQHKDDVFDDPFFKDLDEVAEEEALPPQSDTDAAAEKLSSAATRKAKRREQRAAAEAERRREAELELLLMDDTALQDAAKLGGQLLHTEPEAVEKPKGKLSRKAMLAAKKAERLARKAGSGDEGDGPGQTGAGFKVDVGDSRFEALFTSSDFALDPTDPRFSAGDSASAIMAEAAKRRKGEKHSSKAAADAGTKLSGSEDMKTLVASLKRKGKRQDELKARKVKQQRSA